VVNRLIIASLGSQDELAAQLLYTTVHSATPRDGRL
jgi:hypothetical protein